MPLDITFLGHSGFLLSDGKYAIAIDPFLTGNALARHAPGDIQCQYIALTHAHADHFGDTVDIAKRNNATLIAVFEICQFAGKKGVRHMEPGNTGGKIITDFGYVAFTPAFHSSSYDDHYMGMPCGLIVAMGGAVFYHCGDTALFGDMRLLGEIYKPDIAAIPIGDRFTMGGELAGRAADLINPRYAIPIHYKTFPQLAQDASKFKPTSAKVKEMQPGETWTFTSSS
jgi:L-ascorbate metabolism protein UlaG (beta-lactamase superfamily)